MKKEFVWSSKLNNTPYRLFKLEDGMHGLYYYGVCQGPFDIGILAHYGTEKECNDYFDKLKEACQ